MTDVHVVLILLSLLFVKHWFADFVIQFDYMVNEKGTYGADGGIHHSLIHAMLTWAIVGGMFGVTAGVFVAMFDFLAHYHIDWLKMNISRWRKLTIRDGEFWMWLGADQMAHSLTYIAMALWLTSNKLT
jgi:hypothetical protein